MLLINQLLFPLNTLGTSPLGTVADVVRGGIMVLFFISAVMVILVVLAQEGKGGGLAGAFGGAGAETFGVKAGTVNKFTAWLAAAFLGLALLYAGLSSFTSKKVVAPGVTQFEAPAKGAEEPAIGPKDGTNAEAEESPKDGDSKDGDSKDADPKDADPKDADPKDADPKDADPKDADPKDADPKDEAPKEEDK